MLIFSRYLSFKKKLKEILLKVDSISLTTDLWKNKRDQYFLGLTVHFFDDKLNYQTLLYGFRRFSKIYFANNICNFIKTELGEDLLIKVKLLLKILNFILKIQI